MVKIQIDGIVHSNQKLTAITSNKHKTNASSNQSSIIKTSDDIFDKKSKQFLWCEFVTFLPGIILLIPNGLQNIYTLYQVYCCFNTLRIDILPPTSFEPYNKWRIYIVLIWFIGSMFGYILGVIMIKTKKRDIYVSINQVFFFFFFPKMTFSISFIYCML